MISDKQIMERLENLIGEFNDAESPAIQKHIIGIYVELFRMDLEAHEREVLGRIPCGRPEFPGEIF